LCRRVTVGPQPDLPTAAGSSSTTATPTVTPTPTPSADDDYGDQYYGEYGYGGTLDS
jgi:hypothetical protein